MDTHTHANLVDAPVADRTIVDGYIAEKLLLNKLLFLILYKYKYTNC